MLRVDKKIALILLLHWLVWVPLPAAQMICQCSHPVKAAPASARGAGTSCCDTESPGNHDGMMPPSAAHLQHTAHNAMMNIAASANGHPGGAHPSQWCAEHCQIGKLPIEPLTTFSSFGKGLGLFAVSSGKTVVLNSKMKQLRPVPFQFASLCVVPLYLRHQSFLI